MAESRTAPPSDMITCPKPDARCPKLDAPRSTLDYTLTPRTDRNYSTTATTATTATSATTATARVRSLQLGYARAIRSFEFWAYTSTSVPVVQYSSMLL